MSRAQHTEVERVTPKQAKEWLESNPDNRNIKRSLVRRLAGQMQRGEFKLTHQGVAISKTGRLMDGQHRLLAIIEANKPVRMNVTRNVDDGIFDVIDTGVSRSLSDSLKIPTVEAQILRYITRLHFGNDASTQQAEQVYEAFQQEIKDLTGFCPTRARALSVAPIRAAAVLRMVVNPDRYEWTAEQYRTLVQQDYTMVSHQVGALLRGITNDTWATEKGDSTNLFIRAWVAFDYENRNKRRITVNDKVKLVAEVRAVIDKRMKEGCLE